MTAKKLTLTCLTLSKRDAMWYGEVAIMKPPTLSTNDSSAQLRNCDFRRNFRDPFLGVVSTHAFHGIPLLYCRLRVSFFSLWREKTGTNRRILTHLRHLVGEGRGGLSFPLPFLFRQIPADSSYPFSGVFSLTKH